MRETTRTKAMRGGAAVLVATALGAGMLCAPAAFPTMSQAQASAVKAKKAVQPKKKAHAKKAAEAKRAVWKVKAKRYYCYVNGKKLRGMRTVGGRVYCFSKKGVQRTGWMRIGGLYRYFKKGNGAKGYLVRNRTVNGIRMSINIS